LGERLGRSEEPAVFDTSSLVFLDLLGYVPLLRQLYRVVVPEAVSEELSAGPDSPGSGVVSLDWVTHRVLLRTEGASRRPALRQQVEVCFATLKRTFGLGETLATTLVGLVTRIAAKVTAYTYGLYVNRLLGRPQGRIKELWA
jgi:hypothetical protein